MSVVAEDRISLGKSIEDSGWRQGSLFRPTQPVIDVLSAHINFDTATEMLMIATQSVLSVCAYVRDRQ